MSSPHVGQVEPQAGVVLFCCLFVLFVISACDWCVWGGEEVLFRMALAASKGKGSRQTPFPSEGGRILTEVGSCHFWKVAS